MLYSKNGSIPYPQTDGTEGWIEVEDPPEVPEGKELVWWYPPGWIIRDPKPVKEGFGYSWSQSEEKWTEYALPQETVVLETQAPTGFTTEALPAMTSADISALE